MNDYLNAVEQCKAVNGVLFLNRITGVYDIVVDYWAVLKMQSNSEYVMLNYEYK